MPRNQQRQYAVPCPCNGWVHTKTTEANCPVFVAMQATRQVAATGYAVRQTPEGGSAFQGTKINDATTNNATTNDATTNDATTNDAAINDAATNNATTNNATTNDATTNDATTNDATTNNATTNDATTNDATTNDATANCFTNYAKSENGHTAHDDAHITPVKGAMEAPKTTTKPKKRALSPAYKQGCCCPA